MQIWDIVWPGVSRHSSSTVLPTLITSPARKPWSISGILSLALTWASTLAPVAAIISGLPPVWSMLVGVEDLGDGPPPRLGGGQAFFVVQRIDRQGLAGLPTGDQVVE